VTELLLRHASGTSSTLRSGVVALPVVRVERLNDASKSHVRRRRGDCARAVGGRCAGEATANDGSSRTCERPSTGCLGRLLRVRPSTRCSHRDVEVAVPEHSPTKDSNRGSSRRTSRHRGRGSGNATRQINTSSSRSFPRSVCWRRVFTPAGNWSRYPPQQHDEDHARRVVLKGLLLPPQIRTRVHSRCNASTAPA